jgi:hypothetical protein
MNSRGLSKRSASDTSSQVGKIALAFGNLMLYRIADTPSETDSGPPHGFGVTPKVPQK